MINLPLFPPVYGSNSKREARSKSSGCSFSSSCAEMVFSYPKKAVRVNHVHDQDASPPPRPPKILHPLPHSLHVGIFPNVHSSLSILCLLWPSFIFSVAATPSQGNRADIGDPASPSRIVYPDARFVWVETRLCNKVYITHPLFTHIWGSMVHAGSSPQSATKSSDAPCFLRHISPVPSASRPTSTHQRELTIFSLDCTELRLLTLVSGLSVLSQALISRGLLVLPSRDLHKYLFLTREARLIRVHGYFMLLFAPPAVTPPFFFCQEDQRLQVRNFGRTRINLQLLSVLRNLVVVLLCSGDSRDGDHCPWNISSPTLCSCKFAQLARPTKCLLPYSVYPQHTPTSPSTPSPPWTHFSTSHPCYSRMTESKRHLCMNPFKLLQANPPIFLSMPSGRGARSQALSVSSRSSPLPRLYPSRCSGEPPTSA